MPTTKSSNRRPSQPRRYCPVDSEIGESIRVQPHCGPTSSCAVCVQIRDSDFNVLQSRSIGPDNINYREQSPSPCHPSRQPTLLQEPGRHEIPDQNTPAIGRDGGISIGGGDIPQEFKTQHESGTPVPTEFTETARPDPNDTIIPANVPFNDSLTPRPQPTSHGERMARAVAWLGGNLVHMMNTLEGQLESMERSMGIRE